ncbi:dTMP kinase [Candidatus Methylospira mobilis]|uniref:Thymidylate kinase n=1 Tax=Candidatus Methylospira mobilis TaxID=1808979 RepID=A0A5Q0BNC4_9GAMM|nr:dTMP kinase [Candidatus Methylospira mobilis]QFY43608.1 dTMP kinase [Candidatus Methylospira mobilis]
MTNTNNRNRARFITLEGGEGVGKSSNLAFVQNWLNQQGIRAVTTREPGGTEAGEKVRALFLGDEALTPLTELLLMFAARAEHISRVILPALNKGVWVVSDRFCDASYAYQGGGRGIETEFIAALEQRVLQGLQPDLTLLLDAPVEVGMARARRRQKIDRMESENHAFFENVRTAYLQRAAQSLGRIRIIDATLPLEGVQQQIAAALKTII